MMLLSLSVVAAGALSQVLTSRASVASGGVQVSARSHSSSVSDDGRFVAFVSSASNLVVGDTNGVEDVFVHDRLFGQTTRISINTSGVQGNNRSGSPAVDGNGRFVTFSSFASNLVASDTNNQGDVFIHDRVLGTTQVVSKSTGGVLGTHESRLPSISNDGRYVAFQSASANFVAGDTNQLPDIFVRDLIAGETNRVSVAPGGVQANSMSQEAAISGNGEWIAFRSWATNLVPNDTNMQPDVFAVSRIGGQVNLISMSNAFGPSNGSSEDPSISDDGRFVGFESAATNLVNDDANGLVDVFVRDQLCFTTSLASVSSSGVQGDGFSTDATICGDGRFVAFFTFATNLVPDNLPFNENVVLRDTWTFSTSLASKSTPGLASNFISREPSISGNGRFVAYESGGSNLVPLDTNHNADVFVTDLAASSSGASQFQLVRGRLIGGNLASLQASDDDRLLLGPGITFSAQQPPIEVYFIGSIGTSQISELEIFIESSTSSPALSQTMEIFNYQTCVFEPLGTKNPGTIDSFHSGQPVGDLGEYSSGGEVLVRVTYRANGPLFSYPWQTRIDQVRFVVSN
ncbi:MAG: calcium-binding protein [Armatimonadota bacterium]|nr:calcium-binding protein [Armatimonadota bacterium]